MANRKFYLKENLGENANDLGVKTKDNSTPIVIGIDTVYRVNPVIKEVREETRNTMFGFEIEDTRTGLFADTHPYGIDERQWITYLSLSNDDDLPIVNRLWVSGNNSTSFTSGKESQAFYKNSAIHLTTKNLGNNKVSSAACTTKQVFDCFAATNTFFSFGLRRKGNEINTITRAGAFSNKTGWFLEIVSSGVGNNFKIIRRYTNENDLTIDVPIYRESFLDRLDGSGASNLNLDFEKVTMFGIEVGSYDGTAARFFVYAADEGKSQGSHRWIMFHKVGTSDLNSFPERNSSPLPITIYHQSAEQQDTFAEKYGTSVTRSGTATYPLQIFNIAGSTLELVPAKFKFNLAIYTKELFNNKNNFTKHLIRSLNVNSNVPVEILIRRYVLRKNELEDIGFKPIPKEEFDPSYLVYIVDDVQGEIKFISPELQISVLSVKLENVDQLVYAGQESITLTSSGSTFAVTGLTSLIKSGTVLNFFSFTATLAEDLVPPLDPTTAVSGSATVSSGTYASGATCILTSDHINIIYATIKNSSNIGIIDGSNGKIITIFSTNLTGSINDILWVPGDSTVSNRLHVAYSGGVAIYNISNPLVPVLAVTISSSSVNVKKLAIATTSPFSVTAIGNNTTELATGVIFSYSYSQSSNISATVTNFTNTSFRDIAAIGGNFYILETVGDVVSVDLLTGTTLTSQATNLSNNLTSLTAIQELNYLFAFGGNTITLINFRTTPTATATTTVWSNTATVKGVLIDSLLKAYVYDSSGLIKDYFSFSVLADLSAASSILRANLLSSGISSALRDGGMELIGDEVVSLVAGNKIRQLDLTYAFQEYREFFTSTYENFAGASSLVSQDLILVFLRHLGENLSEFIEQIEWISGSTQTTIVNTATTANPLHITAPGFATISIITGQV